MILDHLQNSARYESLHPGFRIAFEFLKQHDWRSLPTGRHAIDGERVFVLVEHPQGKGREGVRLEAHRKYLDIQLCFSGCETIGWRPFSACRELTVPYDETRDILFFGDLPETWVELVDGWFAVFYPEDAHAPLAANGPLKKAVVKVALDF